MGQAIPIRVFVIENDARGIPVATRQPDVAWLGLEQVLAQPSAGSLASLYASPATGKEPVALMVVTCEPGGTIATHTGPQTFMCWVAQGEGRLTLKGGEPLLYQPNDCIIFKPETLHGWENGDKPAVILVVSVA